MKVENIQFYLDKLILLGLPQKQVKFYTLLKEKGISFNYRTVNEQLEKYCSINRPRIKECYRNSLLLAIACEDIDYVEGYMFTSAIGFPIEHAWNCRVSGNDWEVIDTTAHEAGFKFDTEEYFGVIIPKAVLQDFLETNQHLTALQYYLSNSEKYGL